MAPRMLTPWEMFKKGHPLRPTMAATEEIGQYMARVSEAFHALEPDVLEALKEAALQTKQEATSDKALQAA